MTQRRWVTEDGWRVLTGWDRMLARFFLVIDQTCLSCGGKGLSPGGLNIVTKYGERVCVGCAGTGEEVLFTNLSSRKYPRGDMTLVDVIGELNRLVTAYPGTLRDRLMTDKTRDLGDDNIDYGTIGKLRAGGPL